MTQPVSVQADGNLKVLFVPTIADTEAPTVGELTAGTVIDLSCYLTGDGFTPNTDEQTVTDERICTRQTFEQPGRYQDQLDLAYVYNILSAGDDAARIALTQLRVGNIVARWGQDFEDAVTAGDIVDVYPVKLGVQKKQPPVANSVLRIAQKPFVIGKVQRDVEVAA